MPSSRYPDTSAWLARWLTRNPMYHSQLATLLGVHVKTVNNWSTGVSCMSVRDRLALRYIELELNMAIVSSSTLLGYDGQGKPIYGDTTVIGSTGDTRFPLFTAQEAVIAGIIAENLGVEPHKVTRTASLIDDLGADSLDVVELVMAAEEHFGIEITDEEGDAADTVEKVFNLIAAKKS